jgi:hypothetical protein
MVRFGDGFENAYILLLYMRIIEDTKFRCSFCDAVFPAHLDKCKQCGESASSKTPELSSNKNKIFDKEENELIIDNSLKHKTNDVPILNNENDIHSSQGMNINTDSLGYLIVFTVVCFFIAANMGSAGEFLWQIFGGILFIGIIVKIFDSSY